MAETQQADTLGRAFLLVAERDDVRLTFWEGPDDSTTFSYGRIAAGALGVAGALQAEGLAVGQSVAIVLPTGPDFYRAFFGVVLAGGVPVCLYPPIRFGRFDEWKARTATMLQVCQAQAVITEMRMFGLLGEPVQRAGPKLGCRTVASLVDMDQRAAPQLGGPQDLAAIQFSSGSTGNPKPVGLSHHNMISNTNAILASFPGNVEEQSGLSWLPLYHDMGLIGAMLLAIVTPGDCTLLRPERFIARPRLWLEAMTQTKSTLSVAPNFAYGLCTARITDEQLEGLDLSNWGVAICGAEPVHRHTLDNFVERFSRVGFDERALTPVYGLAEATLAVSVSDMGAPPRYQRFESAGLECRDEAVAVQEGGRELCNLGKPVQGARLAIRNEDRDDLPADKVGTVWLAGDGIMKRYVGRPEATAETIDDGWLDTGDTGFIHEGDLFLCGRRKDIIIIRGRNYDPDIIEQATETIAALRTGCSAAFGASDPELGTERLIVLAELRQGDCSDREELATEVAAAVRSVINLNPDAVTIVDAGTLPRTSSGKIRRAETRRRWLAGELSPVGKGGVGVVLKESVLGLAHHLRAVRKWRSRS